MTAPQPALPAVAVTAFQCASAAGNDAESLTRALLANRSLLKPLSQFDLPFATVIGEIHTTLPTPRAELSAYDCRNARLALLALSQAEFRAALLSARCRYGTGRVGVILGTSTSGILETEAGYFELSRTGAMPAGFDFLHTHTAQATAEFLQRELDLQGPCYAISTACSSSAKALAAGQRLIAADLCDAVLVAGVDSLCRLTLRGFNSLQLIDAQPCRPMDAERQGINIGEAAALLLLERVGERNNACPRLLAVGESSDAHHMSAPHPEGYGAAQAMWQALRLAGREPAQVDHINLHATASRLNDAAEAKAILQVFSRPPPCSGVKGLLGHTLGAAGAVEAIVCLLALQHGFIPGTCGLHVVDPSLAIPVSHEPIVNRAPRLILSNAFGFGGNNASVLLEASL